MEGVLRLQIELTPKTSPMPSLRLFCEKNNKMEIWNAIRDYYSSIDSLESNWYMCLLCEGDDKLETDEMWEYDDKTNTQRFLGLCEVCTLCKTVTYFEYWCNTLEGQKRLNEQGLTKDELIKHFCKVNECTEQDFIAHRSNVLDIYEERNKHNWKLDLGYFQTVFDNGLSESDKEKPSRVISSYWLHADRKTGSYPASTKTSGKWLIFSPVEEIDSIWEKIKKATEDGILGDSSKVSTAKPNATDKNTKVICVYTYDWTDKKDAMRIREELRKLGITQKIPYKTNEDTACGKYVKTGHTRISKYYE